MSIQARQIPCVSSTETRLCAVDFTDKLDPGESLTGTPTVTDSTGDLTLANKSVSTAELTVAGRQVTAGRAVQFTTTGGTAGTRYTISVSVGTDSTPAQTLEADLLLDVV